MNDRILQTCENINEILSDDSVYTMEQYDKFQKNIDKCDPQNQAERIMVNLAHNYLSLHIYTYGDR